MTGLEIARRGNNVGHSIDTHNRPAAPALARRTEHLGFPRHNREDDRGLLNDLPEVPRVALRDAAQGGFPYPCGCICVQ